MTVELNINEADLVAIEAEAAAQELYATQAADQAPAVIPDEDEAPAVAQADDRDFMEIADSVSHVRAEEMVAHLATAWSDRAAYENAKNPNNANIQKTLSKEIAAHAAPGLARMLIAADVPAGYMNVMEVSNARRNIYAPAKLRDMLSGVARNGMTNAINIAVLVSLFRTAAVKLPFTMTIAKAAASDKAFCPPEYHAHMRRHTVSESTAPTQAGSTMLALEILGVVKNVGTSRSQVWQLTDAPVTKALERVVRTRFMPVSV